MRFDGPEFAQSTYQSACDAFLRAAEEFITILIQYPKTQTY